MRQGSSFIDVTSESSFCSLSPAELLVQLHTQDTGVMLSCALAFAAMWRTIAVLRLLGLVARNWHILAVLERNYILFLPHRPNLQRFAAWL